MGVVGVDYLLGWCFCEFVEVFDVGLWMIWVLVVWVLG